jgi:hypothetical protein
MILLSMVKRIFLSLDDSDFEKLKSSKGDRTWEEFLVKPHLEVSDEDLRKLQEAEG